MHFQGQETKIQETLGYVLSPLSIDSERPELFGFSWLQPLFKWIEERESFLEPERQPSRHNLFYFLSCSITTAYCSIQVIQSELVDN